MYRVTLADTPISREHGLMFTPKLPHSEGMLFVFDRPDFHVFWMKNTYIPLDMVWMDCEYRVVDIYRNAQPNSEELIIPTVNSLYVLEVNAGDSDRHRVLPGMQATVDGPLFGLYYFFQEYLNGFFGLEKLLINHF